MVSNMLFASLFDITSNNRNNRKQDITFYLAAAKQQDASKLAIDLKGLKRVRTSVKSINSTSLQPLSHKTYN